MAEYLFDPETGAELWRGEARCTGGCLYGYDVLMPGDASLSVMNSVAYPDPMCEAHGGADVWPDVEHSRIAADQQLRALTLAYERGWLTPY